MAFCIECGAKAPDIAKFCPQCGHALVAPETPASTEKAAAKANPKDKKTPPSKTKPAPGAKAAEDITPEAAPEKSTPTPAPKTPAPAVETTDTLKSRAGLLIGLSLIVLLIAGGGAYAAGLFGSSDEPAEKVARAPVADVIPQAEESAVDDTPAANPVLEAYKAAILTGRISDLGTFATDYPDSSLANDARDAAFASLQRQKSVLAFATFTKYFPNADVSAYSGPRSNADVADNAIVSTESETITAPTTEPAFTIPAIRTSITTRAEDLDPFISQGNTSYALSVIDEMLALTDLNEAEATYLLNLRARTETTQGIAAPAATPDPVAVDIDPSVTSLRPELPAGAAPETLRETGPENPEAEIAAQVKPTPTFDTPAKPIDRFGAITPDAATEPGECDMSFWVDTTGTPVNISATCTDPIFIAPAVETVGEWSYEPATLAGVPVVQEGLAIKIRFHLDAPE